MDNSRVFLQECVQRLSEIDGPKKILGASSYPENSNISLSSDVFLKYFILGLSICEGQTEEVQSDVRDIISNNKYKVLTPKKIRDIAALDVKDAVTIICDTVTKNGKYIGAEVHWEQIYNRCIYAAYICTEVGRFLDDQQTTFAKVPINRGMNALAQINTAPAYYNEAEKRWEICVFNDVTFEITDEYSGKTSTGAIMLNDFFLSECKRAQSPELQIPLKKYAKLRGISATKQGLQKLKTSILKYMGELKKIEYRACERIDGKKVESGTIGINGGTAVVLRGVIYWNYNQTLFQQLMKIAPTDYPKELWAQDPRGNAFFFGRHIALNRRMNEGKPGREKIRMKTLIETSPNLPTYDEVMSGNRNLSARIIRPTIESLDALETLYYDVYDADGNLIEHPESMNYQTFINSYIVVDYTDYPRHTKRVEKRKDHIQQAKEAKKDSKKQKPGSKQS